MYLRTFINT